MTVRVYRSTEFGAPVLSGQAGALIGVLDACLVNGFGSLSITSLTQTGGVATAVTASPHGYANSPKVTVSGATPTEYNGEVTATVTATNSFTFPILPGAAATATGAITVARSGAGFTKAFSGGNLAAYRQPLAGANGFYLRVDDTVAATSRIVGYEGMSGVSTGVNAFPTEAQVAGGLYVVKSSVASATARAWFLVTNGSIFYLVVNQAGAADWATAVPIVYGDITSYKSADAFATLLIASTSTTGTADFSTMGINAITALQAGQFMARSYVQTGGSITIGKTSDFSKAEGGVSLGKSGAVYPSPVDGGLYSAEVYINEPAAGVLRGVLPGLQNPLHKTPLQLFDIWVPGGDLSGRTFEAVNMYSGSQGFFETSDTW